MSAALRAHRRRRAQPGRQRGAAILMAMLTLVLVATLTSAMLWQQWRGLEVEAAQRSRVQSAWILNGALDWARLILREDARQGGADHLAEPWAVPLAPARLSTFLAAERGAALVGDDDTAGQTEAFLSGQIDDQQARLNATNLISNHQLHDPSLAAWTRLFKQLSLPEFELQSLAQALLRADSDSKGAPPGGSASADRPLQPQSVADLRWLGLSERSWLALQPFITLLPQRTPVNLNTARLEVLLACLPGLDSAQAQKLVQARARSHLRTLAEAQQLADNPALKLDAAEHSLSSRFFSVTGQLRLGEVSLQQTSLLQRDGLAVRTLSRSREQRRPPEPTLQ